MFVASVAGVDEAVSKVAAGVASIAETELLAGFSGDASAEGLALRVFLVFVVSTGGASVSEP